LQKQIWNIGKLLIWAIDYFKTKEIPEPRLSAELLLSSVLELSRMDLYLKYDLELNDTQLKKYKEFILRRLNHEPIQYITGEAYFRKIRLDVDKSVLIPRPETELLVERAKKVILHLSALKKSSNKSSEINQVINILDIGTGSGAIALSLLYETGFNEDKTYPIDVFATDISGDALRNASKNADRILSVDKNSHLRFFECDVLPQDDEEFLKKYLNNIDIVISNPPYIAEADYKNLEKQIKDFEPEEALIAGKTGTEKYSHILKKVKPFLNPKSACIIFETDSLTAPELQKIIKAELNESSTDIEKDYNGKDRVLVAFIGN
jgi:release factor glutamine methyltransferase